MSCSSVQVEGSIITSAFHPEGSKEIFRLIWEFLAQVRSHFMVGEVGEAINKLWS